MFLTLLLFVGCKRSASPQYDQATDVAVKYVNLMEQEKYDDLLKDIVSCDSASDVYRSNMRTFLKQFVRSKKKTHVGLKKVESLKTDIPQAANAVEVYLKLTYQNDSTELICFPMIWDKGRWRLR